MWELVLAMHYKLGSLETMVKILAALMVGMWATLLARLLGAF